MYSYSTNYYSVVTQLTTHTVTLIRTAAYAPLPVRNRKATAVSCLDFLANRSVSEHVALLRRKKCNFLPLSVT